MRNPADSFALYETTCAVVKPTSRKPDQAAQGGLARKRRSAPPLHQLEYDVRAICRRNPQGTHAAQDERLRTLLLCAQQWFELGVCRKRAVNLHQADVRKLVEGWHAQQLSAATIRNRLLYLRWLAKKIGKPQLVGSDRFFGVDRCTDEEP
ncbi:MAG TPA: phage integrase N-terminal domain-containing protein [Burkholderiaceae bacterium]|jgi:hypothetical protein